MARFDAKLVGLGKAFVQPKRIARAPFARIEKRVVAFLGKDISREMGAQHFETPAGGSVGWRPVKDFPNRTSGPALRGSTGSIAAAWRRPTVTRSSKRLTITADIGPGAVVHLGGRGTTRTVKETRIFPVQDASKMQGALFFSTGANFRRETVESGIVVPSRPHGAATPKRVERIAEMVLEEMVSG